MLFWRIYVSQGGTYRNCFRYAWLKNQLKGFFVKSRLCSEILLGVLLLAVFI